MIDPFNGKRVGDTVDVNGRKYLVERTFYKDGQPHVVVSNGHHWLELKIEPKQTRVQ